LGSRLVPGSRLVAGILTQNHHRDLRLGWQGVGLDGKAALPCADVRFFDWA
jgi:hypothetical protein